MSKKDYIIAPDGKKWPGFLSRNIFTDHGFKDIALTNSILSDIRVCLVLLLFLQIFLAVKS